MYGTLKPKTCSLACSDRGAYRRFYCGMCKSLGTQYGLMSRVSVNHDGVLYAALIEGMSAASGSQGTCRCPLAPHQHRNIQTPDAPSMRLAAGLQMLLADAWVTDKQVDGNRFAGVLKPFTRKHHTQARRLLQELGLDPAVFDELTTKQQKVEVRREATPSEAAEPTANLLGTLLQQAAAMTTTTPEIAQHEDALYRLGHGLGKAIYLIDALKDLAGDLKKRHYNPGLRFDRSAIDPDRVIQCAHALDQAITQMADGLACLPLQRNQDMIAHILLERFPQEAHAAAKVAYAVAGIAEAPPLWSADPVYKTEHSREVARKRRKNRIADCCGCSCDACCICGPDCDCCCEGNCCDGGCDCGCS